MNRQPPPQESVLEGLQGPVGHRLGTLLKLDGRDGVDLEGEPRAPRGVSRRRALPPSHATTAGPGGAGWRAAILNSHIVHRAAVPPRAAGTLRRLRHHTVPRAAGTGGYGGVTHARARAGTRGTRDPETELRLVARGATDSTLRGAASCTADAHAMFLVLPRSWTTSPDPTRDFGCGSRWRAPNAAADFELAPSAIGRSEANDGRLSHRGVERRFALRALATGRCRRPSGRFLCVRRRSPALPRVGPAASALLPHSPAQAPRHGPRTTPQPPPSHPASKGPQKGIRET